MRAGQKPKILMIGPVPYRYGGISKVAGAILDSDLPKEFFELRYLASGTKGGRAEKLWYAITAFVRFTWALLVYRPNLIHLHVSKEGSLLRKAVFATLARMQRTPVIIHLHCPAGPENEIPDFILDGPRAVRRCVIEALRRADCFVGLSPSYVALFRPVIMSDNFVSIPNPIVCSDFAGCIETKKEDHTVLFMGELTQAKGVFDLIRSMPLVLERVANARLILCGKGEESEAREAVRAAEVEKSVELPGFVSGLEKLAWYERASVFVLPSYQEAFPIAILEAMAAGLPIIATPVGGVPDAVQAGVNGYLVQPGDVYQLADRIVALLQDEDLRREIGQRNREEALAEYDVSVFVQRLTDLYERLLTRSPSCQGNAQ